MHEGLCEVPTNLAARTFTLAGASVREYPDYIPPNPPSGYVPQPLVPEIVATGTVLPGITTPAMDPEHFGGTHPANARTFGIIGAFDGHRVGKGRVVVDSTWHHFFDINLTGDRFLEDNSLSTAHQQKLHGFYVLDGSGTRVPCNEYKMIMWYFRNLVYWLIPATRYRHIWWDTLYELARKPKIWEESLAVADSKILRFDHYFHFGQLAEEYLQQARGHCSTFTIHEFIYKEKIPWWEWIQRFTDVWNPVPELRRESIRLRTAGALGLGPRPETAATVGLGAALLTAALSRHTLSRKDPPAGATFDTMQELWPRIEAQAIKEYGKHVELGSQTQREIAAMVKSQLEKDTGTK
jgi:hypothetical protein